MLVRIELDQRIGRGQKAPITKHTLAVQRICDRQCQKLAFEQHSLGSALLICAERYCCFRRSGHGLQPWVMEEDAFALTALHYEEG